MPSTELSDANAGANDGRHGEVRGRGRDVAWSTDVAGPGRGLPDALDLGFHCGPVRCRTHWNRDSTASERGGSGVSGRSSWSGADGGWCWGCRWGLSPESGGLAGGYLLADDGGDAVAAHG